VARAKKAAFDLSAFPPGTATLSQRYVCLACIFDVFTKQLKMAPKTAYAAVRGHAPTLEELTGDAARPYFESDDRNPRCPYCESAKRWLAELRLVRVEGSRSTVEARKAFAKSLPKAAGQVLTVEKKASRRELLFEWLDALGEKYDFDDPAWLIDCTRAFLEKREPKADWAAEFPGVRQIRKSQRLDSGWEREGPKLYLAPELYYEALLVQYLVSRSHRSGGLTLEGRMTIAELLRRLRGYARHHKIEGDDPLEFLENLVDSIDPGGASVKLVYFIDRREFLEKSKEAYGRYAG
jgi:glutaredoxin